LLQLHWPERYTPLFGASEYNHDFERPDSTPIEDQIQIMA